MNNMKATKTYLAGATITQYRIAKVGADDNHVIQGAAATDKLLGVVDIPGAPASTSLAEEPVDVVLAGPALVEAGGTFAGGDLLSADSSGRAILAAASAGANVRTIGTALKSAVIGDIVLIYVTQGSFQG